MAGFTRFLSGAEKYLDRVGRWTPSTRVGYGVALAAFARSHDAPNVGSTMWKSSSLATTPKMCPKGMELAEVFSGASTS